MTIISKYLADPTVDVRLSAENCLSEFLREIKYIADVQEKQADTERQTRERRQTNRPAKQKMKDIGEEGDTALDTDEEADDEDGDGDGQEEWEGEGSGAWVPGQGVAIDHAAIMDIIIQHLSYPGKLAYY